MFVHFRKRILEEVPNQINELIAKEAMAETSRKTEKQPDNNYEAPGSGTGNKGKLILDAACAPEDINYLTELKLINKARP